MVLFCFFTLPTIDAYVEFKITVLDRIYEQARQLQPRAQLRTGGNPSWDCISRFKAIRIRGRRSTKVAVELLATKRKGAVDRSRPKFATRGTVAAKAARRRTLFKLARAAPLGSLIPVAVDSLTVMAALALRDAGCRSGHPYVLESNACTGWVRVDPRAPGLKECWNSPFFLDVGKTYF
eukprot:334073-Amphidinium_carterae.1